jgi:CheY-like chemotaxis protein/HPt (histidine-containing phosphotransfer) domain-containing protein
VNQEVGLRILQHIGYTADVAASGKEVLALLRNQTYDVILMDVQMPEMDGLETTKYICEQWSADERPRIIAMTANAMEEDRQRCLAAGMDDYVSKPIRLEELRAALEGLTPTQREQFEPAGSIKTIDIEFLDKIREYCGDEDDIVPRLVELYLEDTPPRIVSLREAVGRTDVDEIKSIAHAMKGSSANIGALRMSALCAELESKDSSKDESAIDELATEIEREVARAREALLSLVDSYAV